MLEHQVQLKQPESDDIKRRTEQFLLAGGRVTQVESSVFANADMSLSDGRRPDSFTTKTKGRKK